MKPKPQIKYCPICKDYQPMRDEGVQADEMGVPLYRQYGCLECKGSFSNPKLVMADPGRNLIKKLISGEVSEI